MSQGNSQRCGSTRQETAATAHGSPASRDRDDEDEGRKDHVLSREDTAPFEEQAAHREGESMARRPSSAVDAITCQPQASGSARCLSTGEAGESTAPSQNGSRRAAQAARTNTEAVIGPRSTVTQPPIGPSARGTGVERPTPSTSRSPHGKLQSHPSINSRTSKKSKSSSRSTASQIPSDAEEDCCVHCILACLFCQFLTLCNLVLDCATCGSCSSDTSCCFCCGSEECAACDLPCDMDCGIVDACCESADCLEICMECCGLCFSS
uniref:myoD family inhibitor n=1 Tax=Pristiophorus japonicus TaxID=55135 RepID=UPI00398F21E6